MTTVEVRWRPDGEKPHFFLKRKSQHGDPAGSVSVELFDVSGVDAAKWAEGGVACPAASADDVAVRFSVPGNATALRLAFTVAPQVNGKSVDSIVLWQRLVLNAGRLVADRYQAPRFSVSIRTRGGDDPVAQQVPFRSTTQRVRAFTGTHPLLRLAGTKVSVETEFLDVTNLWWELHFRPTPKNPPPPLQFSPWFLAPGMRTGQAEPGQGRLAVLVNTLVKPMLWFATVPEAASGPLPDGASVGGYLFFRPPGGSPFPYSSDGPDGLAGAELATTGLETLSRYLLAGHGRPNKPEITMLPAWPHLLDHLERSASPLTAYGALPCGMERALDRSAVETLRANRTVRVLLLPQYSTTIGYGSLPYSDLPARIDAALRLLWSAGWFGGPAQQLVSATGIATPQTGGAGVRLTADHWLGCYSRSGDTMWEALKLPANRARTERLVIFDPTNLFALGAPRLRETATARRRHGLRIFLAWTPYAVGRAPTDLAAQLTGLGATVTVLPETGPDYFRMPPNPKAPWVEYIFADNPWPLSPLDKAGGWWHQIIAFAGEHLAGEPSSAGSVSFMHATMRR